MKELYLVISAPNLFIMASCLFISTFCTFLSKQIKCWTFMWKSVVFTLAATLFLCWIPIFMFDKGVEQEKTFVSLPEVCIYSYNTNALFIYVTKTIQSEFPFWFWDSVLFLLWFHYLIIFFIVLSLYLLLYLHRDHCLW